jgi:Ca2+-binding EF-hand superfamily protein
VADASEYKATFELVDVDGDGFITAAEFKSLMRALGQEITDARAVEVVVSGDRNRDGKISLEEFADFMAAGGTLAG